jgi:hypothetical protein
MKTKLALITIKGNGLSIAFGNPKISLNKDQKKRVVNAFGTPKKQ